MIRLLFFLPILFLTTCKTNVPVRVAGIPEKAFWVGGPDGGQWYLIDSADKAAKTIKCKIYNDYSGELEIDKKFELHCLNAETEIKWGNLQDEFNGFDGLFIYLKTIDGNGKNCYFK